MGGPRACDVDGQRAVLDASDIPLRGLSCQGMVRRGSKNPEGTDVPEERLEDREPETSERVEHRYDLRGMAVAVAGNGAPDQRHRRLLKRPQRRSRLGILLNVL